MRGRMRGVLLLGTAVLMLWTSPTTAKPGLPAIPLATSPNAAISSITLLLENDNANGAVFGGLATAAGGFGVVGLASNTSSANFGVAGATNSSTGTGVFGLTFATTCPNVSPPVSVGQTCVSVIGQSVTTSPIPTPGVIGGIGVSGLATSGTGVVGQSTAGGNGILGFSSSTLPPAMAGGDVFNGNGVTGITNVFFGSGVLGLGLGGDSVGVTGIAGPGNLAGNFVGPVKVTGGLTDTGNLTVNNGNLTVNGNSTVTGTKSALVDTVSYGKRQLYAVESPESWFEDFGSAKLTNGHAIVTLDPIFAQTVNTEDEYYIFLTPKGNCKGLYVADQRTTLFEVKESQNGKSSIAFDYRIVAKRKGYERARLPQPTK